MSGSVRPLFSSMTRGGSGGATVAACEVGAAMSGTPPDGSLDDSGALSGPLPVPVSVSANGSLSVAMDAVAWRGGGGNGRSSLRFQ
jgi:hypothetical protein